MHVKISVVIPLKRINDYVRECLDHLSRQTYGNFDVYVITDDPETCETQGLDVHFLSSGPVPPNYKRMQAAAASDAEIVALIDDDAFPVPGWLAAGARHFAGDDVIAVGGPGVTPDGDGVEQQASGAVYASPLVSASFVYRYLPRAARDVDDFPSCNLMVRRQPFLATVGECLRYWPGEDTKLCLLLIQRSGKRIVYEPAAIVNHHRRKLFWGHFRQVWNYAVHRGFFAKRYPETSRRPTYFVPTVFVAANLAALIAVLAVAPARPWVAGLAAIYTATVFAAAVASRRSHRAPAWLVAVGIYLTHVTYGIGVAVGLVRRELDH